jgi:serine/threonine protein kinase
LPALHDVSPAQGRPWGRIPYFSPEQAAGEKVHAASDVYVIGCLLYEMLTGRPPFRASDETVLALQHLRHEPPSLEVLLPHAPPALAKIVHRAMAKEPAVRYRNAGQLAYILKAQVGGRPEEQPAMAPQPAWERLVVPPPPVPSQVADWSTREVYILDGDDDWSDEPEGVDWLLIGLLIAALIAVLGLIPLWRTVYRRYTSPLPASSARLHTSCEQGTFGSAGFSEPCRAELPTSWLVPDEQANLAVVAFVWYNCMPAQPSGQGCGLVLRRQDSVSKASALKELSQFGSQAYGFPQKSVVDW